MDREIFLEHYCINGNGERAPIGRNGPAKTYRASDRQSGAPVALTLLPIASIDPSEREHFEEKARAATLLDHINIARTVAFGTTDEHFVFVSEYPQGETVQEWITEHGPMPPDAVLRIALQVLAALGAASFHGLTHPAIEPSNIIIVPGKTLEGGWPFVKLMHFALAGLNGIPPSPEEDVAGSDFASPEQLLRGTVDFPAEIYSLGVTMCFLLTGVFYSAQPRWPQTKRFARPLRNLIARTLADTPSDRPQDPVLFALEIRNCLSKIERRQVLQQKVGIPFAPIVAKPPKTLKVHVRGISKSPIQDGLSRMPMDPALEAERELETRTHRSWILRGALTAAAILLGLGIVAAFLLPEDVVRRAFQRDRSVKTIGVPIGVPDAVPVAPAPNDARLAANNASPAGGAPVQANAANSSPGATKSPRAAAASTSAQMPALQSTSMPPPPVANANPAAVAQAASVGRDSVEPARMAPQSLAQTPSDTPEVDRHDPAAPTNLPPTNDELVSAASNSAAQHSSSPTQIASNNLETQPPPPAQGPHESEAQTSSAAATDQQPATADNNAEPDRAGEAENKQATRLKENQSSSSSVAAAKTRGKVSASGTKIARRSAESSRKTRLSESAGPRPQSRPGRSGTMRARVVGMTPGGNLILRMPSGELAFVRPRSANNEIQDGPPPPRRVIIQRQEELPPPLQPFRLDPNDD
ncbi:MAG: eukaryotic-like serine/threonine-protein kinase [Verrucomicrobiota bacterium]|jgi:serine/threonine protein kinase